MQPKVKPKSGKPSSKPISSKSGLKTKKDMSFPLEKENFVLIGAGIILLVIGYVLMAQNSVDGFVPTVISPILLVIGYCVLIPYGILKRPKVVKTAADMPAIAVDPNTVPDTSKSNIKTS